MSTTELESQRGYLIIDRDNLDQCLMEQPEVYYHVAKAFAQAVSERDACKLNVEECLAKLDQELRSEALRLDEKLTETAIQNRLKTLPAIKSLRQSYMDRCKEADDWQALKEAFQQRSFMLRELVALFIAQRHDLAMEAGAGQARIDLSEQNRKKNDELRRQRRPVV